MKKTYTADGLKRMLWQIYKCKYPFELLLVDKSPKTRAGVYIVRKRRIRIYSKYAADWHLEATAIHEYAHHIHETEKRKSKNRRRERAHGPEFWRIYSALMAVAQLKGVFRDPLIGDLVEGFP